MLSSIEAKEKEKGDADRVATIAAYREKVRASAGWVGGRSLLDL